MIDKGDQSKPEGELAIRTLAMPANTNPDGDIFGGWVVSHMDLAGLSVARKYTKNRAVTVSINAMSFLKPVRVGDFICCYAKILEIGNTSMKIQIQTWVIGPGSDERIKVTEGIFTFVTLDENGKPTKIQNKI